MPPPSSDDIQQFAHSYYRQSLLDTKKQDAYPIVACRYQMEHSATDSSQGSTQVPKKRGRSLVLSLADQKLTVEDNDDLEKFIKGMCEDDLSF